MKVREVSRNGAILTLEIDGKVREFFVDREEKQFSSYSSSLVKAGDCISYTATLSEVVEKKYNDYGLDIVTSYEKFEYFKGWAGLNYVEDFKEIGK